MALLGACADNERHCERSTERINDERIDCGLDPLNVSATCFAYADLNELDCREYFDCQADRMTCEEGQLVQDLRDCPPCR